MRLLWVLAVILVVEARKVKGDCRLDQEFADAQEMLDCYVERYRLVGTDVGVLTGSTWLSRAHAGKRIIGDETPISDKDQYIMGSTGKSITATLCARLVAQGYINWNTTTKEMFYDTGLMNVHESYWPSTLQDFVSHSSGAPGLDNVVFDITDQLFDLTSWVEGYDNRPARLLLSESILKDPVTVPQGVFLYSIGGFTVGGTMLELATNKTFEQLLREEIYDPLGMEGCGWGPTSLNTSLPPTNPWGHLGEPNGNHIAAVPPGDLANIASSMIPDGGLHCNLDSWSRYIAMHMSEDEDYLPADVWNHIHNPVTQGFYGFGWFFDTPDPITGQIWQHGGTDGHNFAQAFVIPRFNIALLIGMNNAGPMQEGRQSVGFGAVLNWMFTHVLGKEVGPKMAEAARKNLIQDTLREF